MNTDSPAHQLHPVNSADSAENTLVSPAPTAAQFLPYPTSTLSPKIIPNDLSTFKTRGISQVEKDMQQQLNELQSRYAAVVDEFNWNKLIYESTFGFQPVMGEDYHLYQDGDAFTLSLIAPEQWKKRYVGTFTLGYSGRWIKVRVAEDFDLSVYVSQFV